MTSAPRFKIICCSYGIRRAAAFLEQQAVEAQEAQMTRPLPLEAPEPNANVAAGVLLIAALEILAVCAALAILGSIISNLP